MSTQVKATRIECFGRSDRDSRYLAEWRAAPLNYRPGQTEGSGWHADAYDEVLARDADGGLFNCAADRLMRYQFYPASIMQATSDFGLANRWMRVGDRIIQRVRVLRVLGMPVIELLTMNEVIRVVAEPRRKGFTCVTTQGHSEMGEWSAAVEWSPAQELILHVHALSRSTWALPLPVQAAVRRFQLHAHYEGIRSFKHDVLVDAGVHA